MKNKVLLFIIGCVSLVWVSCMDSNEVDYAASRDCRISTFSLSHDSMPTLGTVRFTIDQLTGRIFNIDSMPFGTVLRDKVVCSLNYGPGTQSMQVVAEASNDTIWWGGKDSIDFRKPVHFTTYAYDNVTKLTYEAQLNIHQVNPDTMNWYKETVAELGFPIAEETVLSYTSANGSTQYLRYVKELGGAYRLFVSPMGGAFSWTEQSLSGLPVQGLFLKQLTRVGTDLYILGEDGTLFKSKDTQTFEVLPTTDKVCTLLGGIDMGQRQEECLVVLAEKDNILRHAVIGKTGTWRYGDAVKEDFPVKGAASTSFESMNYNRLFLAGGYGQSDNVLKSAWVSLDGLVWAETIKKDSVPFGYRGDAALAQYDEKLFLLGGFDEKGAPTSDIYVSPDEGVTWAVDTMLVLPAEFMGRGKSSIVVDDEDFLHVFGGTTKLGEGEALNDIWTGRINRLGFVEQ